MLLLLAAPVYALYMLLESFSCPCVCPIHAAGKLQLPLYMCAMLRCVMSCFVSFNGVVSRLGMIPTFAAGKHK